MICIITDLTIVIVGCIISDIIVGIVGGFINNIIISIYTGFNSDLIGGIITGFIFSLISEIIIASSSPLSETLLDVSSLVYQCIISTTINYISGVIIDILIIDVIICISGDINSFRRQRNVSAIVM